MKKATSILLLLIMTLPILGKTGVWIWFKANQDWIASTLCINKDNKKAEACKGCCYLDKQLKKVEEPASSNSKPINESKFSQQEEWFYNIIAQLKMLSVQNGLTHYCTFQMPLFSGHKNRLNKPPAIS